MKKIFLVLPLLALAICSPSKGQIVKADSNKDVANLNFWNSLSYSPSENNGVLSFEGESTWGDTFYSADKVDLDGYKIDLEFEYAFNDLSTNFDWFGLIFAPGNNPFVNSGAALTLLLRPQTGGTYFAFMTNTYAEVVSDRTDRNDDKYSIEIHLTDTSVSATVNNKTITTDVTAINYKLLKRGVFNAFTANGGNDFQGNRVVFHLSNMNFNIHDSSKDQITYGASISIEDEEMKKLTSNNFKVESKAQTQTTTNGCSGSLIGSSIVSFVAISLSIILFSVRKKYILGGIKHED